MLQYRFTKSDTWGNITFRRSSSFSPLIPSASLYSFTVTKSGMKALMDKDPAEAHRTGQMADMSNNPITLIKEGRIHYRDIPKQQSLEEWNEFWSEYKNS